MVISRMAPGVLGVWPSAMIMLRVHRVAVSSAPRVALPVPVPKYVGSYMYGIFGLNPKIQSKNTDRLTIHFQNKWVQAKNTTVPTRSSGPSYSFCLYYGSTAALATDYVVYAI